MKFVSTHSNLLKGISLVSPLAGRNTQLPILQHVLMEVKDGLLNLTCTDLEVGAHITVVGKVETNGSCTVVSRQLMEFIQQLPSKNPITLEFIKNKLVVTTPGYSANFTTGSIDDFPPLPVSSNPEGVVVDGRILSAGISRTVFSANKDESRPEIFSLYIVGENDKLRLAATDSFRLAEQIVEAEGVTPFSFLLPVATAQEVAKLFGDVDEVSIYIHENFVVFKGGSIYLSSRLIDASYPDYQQIIPKSFKSTYVIDKSDLLRALKVLSVFLPRESRRVKLTTNTEKGFIRLAVEGGDAGQGDVSIDIEGGGEDVEVLFNIQYLIEGLSHLPGDKCELNLGGDSDPIMVKPVRGTSGYLYVVMPIQV